MMRRVPDCRRARELVGFVPARDLDTILRDVVDEHRAVPLARRVLATP
jgi:UDP-glucose 4-epimerase